MKQLTEKQRELLFQMPLNVDLDIATSEYSIDPIEGQWNPSIRTTHQTIKALMDKGYLEGRTFWRGARVRKVKSADGHLDRKTIVKMIIEKKCMHLDVTSSCPDMFHEWLEGLLWTLTDIQVVVYAGNVFIDTSVQEMNQSSKS